MRRPGGVLACAVAALVGCSGRAALNAGARGDNAGVAGGPAKDAAAQANGARDAGAAGADAANELPPFAKASDAGRERATMFDAAPATDATRLDDAQRADGPAGAADVPSRTPRVLTQVLSGAPWYGTQRVMGMAVDGQDRVYLADGQDVYMVAGKTVSLYLTAAEAGAPLNLALNQGVAGVDIDDDGLLYILARGISQAGSFGDAVLRSSAPHVATPWLDLSKQTVVGRMAVISPGHVAVIDRDGMNTFSDAGAKPAYTEMQLISTYESCADQDLVAAPSGVFLYQPGCNGSPLLRGMADGSGVAVLYDGSTFSPYAENFLCSARDPAGGFYFVVDQADNAGPRLYHVSEQGKGADGLDVIDTAPTFLEAKLSQNETFGFYFCSLAAARDGTVFLQTYSQLWKVSPP